MGGVFRTRSNEKKKKKENAKKKTSRDIAHVLLRFKLLQPVRLSQTEGNYYIAAQGRLEPSHLPWELRPTAELDRDAPLDQASFSSDGKMCLNDTSYIYCSIEVSVFCIVMSGLIGIKGLGRMITTLAHSIKHQLSLLVPSVLQLPSNPHSKACCFTDCSSQFILDISDQQRRKKKNGRPSVNHPTSRR